MFEIAMVTPKDKKKIKIQPHRASKDGSVRKTTRKERRHDSEIPLNQRDDPVPLTFLTSRENSFATAALWMHVRWFSRSARPH